MIWRNAASHYLSTAFGRSLVALIPSPIRYIRWLADHRDHFCNHGTWTVIEHDANYVTMEMKDELIWLETAHRGGAEGVLAAFGVRGTVEPELTGPYDGRLHIRWWRPS